MIFSAKTRRVWADLQKAYKIMEEHAKYSKSEVFLDYVLYNCGRGVEFVFKYDKRGSHTLAECVKTRRGLSRGIVNEELYYYFADEYPFKESESALDGIC